MAMSVMVVSSASASVDGKTSQITVYAPQTMLADMPLAAENQPVVQFAQKIISASKAKMIARSRVKGGEVVDVSLRGKTYRVRVIAKNGRVVDVLIDANTGRVK